MQYRSDPDFPDQDLVNKIFPGKGELACMCREKDWSGTVLGPVESWPVSLRSIAALIVGSPLPMIVLWGPELVQIYNDGYRKVMGEKHPAGLGQPTRQCWPEVWEFTVPIYEGVINRLEAFTFDSRHLVIKRHGHPEDAFFTLNYSPVMDDRGAAGGVLATVSETTAAVERAQIEAAQAESEERLRVALEAADLGTWDLDLTTDTAAVRSLRHDQIFGYEQKQAEWGQEIATRHVLPEDRPVIQEAFARAAHTGVLSCEVRVRWPDGSIRWIAPLGRTYYDSEGRPVRMAGVVADVTERNWADTLRQSEERFRLMADVVPQIVWITDSEGHVEFFNQQWSNYTGLAYEPKTAAEVAATVIHPDDVAITVERFERALHSGETFQIEHRIRSAAGDYRWFLVRAEPYRDPVHGQISRWFGASVDINDHKQAEEGLRLLTARQTFQLALADRIRPLSDPNEVAAAASELLGKHFRVSRVAYAQVSDEGESVLVMRDWTNGELPSMAKTVLRLDDFGPLIAGAIRAGETLAIADVAVDERSAAYADAYIAFNVRSFVAIPLMKSGRLLAILNLHDSAVHHWTEDEIAMAADMVDRTWAAVDNARAQAALRYERDQSRYIFDSMTEGFALISPDWTVLQANAEALRITQRTASEVLGRNHWEVWPALIGTDTEGLYRRVRETGVAETMEMSHVPPDGNEIWIELRAYPSLDGGLATFFRNITKRKETEAKLRHASMHDSLTALPNRAMLFEYAGHLLPHNRRTNTCAAVLFMDLDRFKPINDTHGHDTGDEVLKEVAGRLSRSLRAEDIVIRLGGDEFVILLQDIKEASYAGEVASHIVNKVNEPYLINDLTLSLSTSVGISIFPGDGQDIDTLISHADAAMYQAKQAGRNNYQFYSAESAAGTRLQLLIEQQLRSALHSEAFHLCYQPVLDLQSGDIVSVEALLRWKNSDIGPDRFVPIAEATGIINPIGRWVLKEASRQHKAWLAGGLPAIPVAVNVSVVEFRDRDFVSRFERLLVEYGIEPAALQVELTETAVMDDIEHAIKVLSQLQALGVTILLDDFGTGQSSVTYLARLPLNKIKIDKSFVNRLDHDLASRAITDAMLALGDTLGLEVVAEGIESQAVLDYLLSRGCQQAQGYYLSKPMSGDAFLVWYRQHWQEIELPCYREIHQRQRQPK